MEERDAEQLARHAEQKLQELQGKDFLPRELVGMIAEVTRLHLAESQACRVELPPGLAAADPDLHAQGRALLEPARFPHDAEQARRLFGQVLDILDGVGGAVAEAAAVVRAELEAGGLDQEQVLAAFLRGDEAYFAEYAKKTPGAPLTLAFLAQASLTPSLEAVAGKLLAGRDPKLAWDFGHCPACGRPPLLAELAGAEGARMLTCSFCHARYRAPRISCPFCDERDAKKLLFFTVDQEPGFRVDTCATCKRYIKTADFRKLDKACVPLLDDLASLALDLVASREGYSRPTLSGWGF